MMLCVILSTCSFGRILGCAKRTEGVRESATRPGDAFHPDFCNGRPTYFDVSVRSALHPGVLIHSTSTSGFAALQGEIKEDAKHNNLVEECGHHRA